MPLIVTDKAAQLLKDIQLGHEEATEKTLRLVHKGDSFELTFDAASDDDQVFQTEGTNVLLVAPAVAEILAEATIDAQETTEGPRLTLTSQSA
ncbi:MAG: hypothetical protein HYS09_06425 [Chloroflexi bacterium]|nr:hypothetical protein [Chloroflexota bacterium]